MNPTEQLFPSLGGRGYNVSKLSHFHPHPNPLPSREREFLALGYDWSSVVNKVKNKHIYELSDSLSIPTFGELMSSRFTKRGSF